MFEGLLAPWHVLVLSAIALMVLGPKELPVMARRAGSLLTDFKQWRTQLESELRGALSEETDDTDPH